MIKTDRRILDDLPDRPSGVKDVVGAARETLARMERLGKSLATSPPLTLNNIDDHIPPDLARAFKEVKKAHAEENVFAATAGAQELLRRLCTDDRGSLQASLVSLVNSSELTGYLEPLLRLHANVLKRESIGNADAAAVLLRLCTIIIVYKYIVPKWVESYLNEPIGPTPAPSSIR